MKSLVSLLLAIVSAPAFGQVAIYGGRQYTPENYSRGVTYQLPNCRMCNNIRAQWRAQGWVSGSGANKVMVSTISKASAEKKPPAKAKATETKYRTVTKYRSQMYRVRRCVNGRCQIFNECRQVPYQVREAYEVPVKTAAKSPFEAKKKPEPDRNKVEQCSTDSKDVPVTADIADMPDGTPQIAVDAILAVMGLDEGDTLWDIGSGRDARVLVTACKRYGCKGVGIEINPDHAASSRKIIEEEGLSDKITIITADALEQSYGAARKVFLYQYDDVQETIIKLLSPGTLAACYMHQPGGMDTRPFRVGEHPFFVGVK